MKGTSAIPGGLLMSKPDVVECLRVFHHVGFFCSRVAWYDPTTKEEPDGQSPN